jgi:hypothetical protein
MNIFQDIAQCLKANFDKISLPELEQVKLMDRYDTKCFFHINKLPDLLKNLANHYRVLEIANLQCLQYDSLYFDTADFGFYYNHHNERSNRYKLRYRQYVESNKLTFFEVKFKSNKGRTIKKRVKCTGIASQIPQESLPLLGETNLSYAALVPVVRIQYKRITLVNNDFSERVTIDIQLSFEQENQAHQLPEIAIVEVKQDKVNRRSPIMQVLHNNHIHPGSLSKYCLGMLLCYPQLKNNNFKKTMLRVQKTKENN